MDELEEMLLRQRQDAVQELTFWRSTTIVLIVFVVLILAQSYFVGVTLDQSIGACAPAC